MKTTFVFATVMSLFLLAFQDTQAQKQGNIWYFGVNAGLDFNNGAPVALTNGQLNSNEGTSVMCDANGNLLFYTDGVTVYNRNHSIMNNGSGLQGGGSTSQSATIVPQPGSTTIYYIFTVSPTNNSVLRYSIVNMSGDGGLGQIGSKNVSVLSNTDESLCVIPGNDLYWIVTHRKNSDIFNSYQLTASGFSTSAVSTAIGLTSGIYSDVGYMKTNLQGNRLAIAYHDRNRTEVFNFNPSTGRLSNVINLTVNRPYGVEFSPDGNLLYVHGLGYGTYQFNLQAGNAANIQSSRVLLSAAGASGGAVQLAIDGRIYIANPSGQSISVINNPTNMVRERDTHLPAFHLVVAVREWDCLQ